MKLVHWPLMNGLLYLVQRGGDWAGPQPAQAPHRCTKCNSPSINGQCTNFILVDVHYNSLCPLKGKAFAAGAPLQTPLGELTTLPRPSSRMGRGYPLPTPYPLGPFGASILAPSALASPFVPYTKNPAGAHDSPRFFWQIEHCVTSQELSGKSMSMDQLSGTAYLLELRSPDISLDVFKARLKTFLFNCWLSAFGVFYSNFALCKCP